MNTKIRKGDITLYSKDLVFRFKLPNYKREKFELEYIKGKILGLNIYFHKPINLSLKEKEN